MILIVLLVNFLEAADTVTMLEDGAIVRNQVKYSAYEPSEWGVTDESSDSADSSSEDSRSENGDKVKRREADRAESARKAEAELSRQTGDIDCYKIYLRSMGVTIVPVTLVLVVIAVVSEKLPSMLTACVLYVGVANCWYRYLVEDMDRKGNQYRTTQIHGCLCRVNSYSCCWRNS